MFCSWARAGTAKPIANPARASSKRIFVVFLPIVLEWLLVNDLLPDFLRRWSANARRGFCDSETRRNYAVEALRTVWSISRDLGIQKKLHLWPDRLLRSKQALMSERNLERYAAWLA